METLAEVTRKLAADFFSVPNRSRLKIPGVGRPEESQSSFSHPSRLTQPEQLLLPGWFILGVATHCHTDGKVDVLDQQVLQGF